jgi:hypothetical protein
MSTLAIVIATIVIYNLIGLLIYAASHNNDNFAYFWTMGVFSVIFGFFFIIVKFIDSIDKKLHVRSVIYDNKHQTLFYCQTKNADDFLWYTPRFQLDRRYVRLSKIKEYDQKCIKNGTPDKIVKPVDKSLVNSVKVNCNHCKYNNACLNNEPYCAHDKYGYVTQFDRFEKK